MFTKIRRHPSQFATHNGYEKKHKRDGKKKEREVNKKNSYQFAKKARIKRTHRFFLWIAFECEFFLHFLLLFFFVHVSFSLFVCVCVFFLTWSRSGETAYSFDLVFLSFRLFYFLISSKVAAGRGMLHFPIDWPTIKAYTASWNKRFTNRKCTLHLEGIFHNGIRVSFSRLNRSS